MVDTRKFSDFASAGDLAPNQDTVGVNAGVNVQYNNPFPLLAPGSTGDRPAPAASMYFRLRFNTTTETYEYYSPTLPGWIELEDSQSVLPLLASHLAGEGASLIGLQNQGAVTNKFVQDLANASLVTATDNGTLVNGVILSILPTGFVTVTTGTGVLNSRTISGTANQINVTNTDGAGNSVHSLSSTLNLPGTFNIQSSTAVSAIINDNTMATASATNIPTALSVKTYVDAVGAGLVDSVTGTLNRIDVNNTDPANPVVDISTGYVGQASITTLGTIVTGTWNATILTGTYGGTGVNNGASTITLGGSLTTSGAFASTFTMTGATSVTFPTSGTLATTAGTVSSVSGTANRITSTGGTTPVIDISAAYVGQTSITTLGTIGTGTWQGGVVGATYGGTGINNGASTITLGGSIVTAAAHTLSGAFASTFTFTGITTVTFPTSGTLATTSQIPTGAALTKTDDTNVTLTLGGSPTTALVNAASITVGWSGQLAITRGGTGVSSVTTAPTATAFAGWDANSNFSASSLIPGFATTVTAAATTTLTVASKGTQEFTGVTTQTVTLPVTSTLVAGQSFYIINNSSGNVTVQSSGANTVQVLAANTSMIVTCVLNSGTTAASWNGAYIFDAGGGVSSITGTATQIVASASTGAITLSLATGMNGLADVKVYNTADSPATWTKPAGLKYVIVWVIGAGGAGGGSASSAAGNAAQGGGGGAGAVGYRKIAAASLGATETVTIGAGGTAGSAGNNPGNAGGTSSFGALVSCTGGGGGTGMPTGAAANSVAGGAGGTASSGDLNFNGAGGSLGLILAAGSLPAWSAGGGNIFAPSTNRAALAAADVAKFAGGGGGGSSTTPGGGNAAGAAGANGLVMVYEYQGP